VHPDYQDYQDAANFDYVPNNNFSFSQSGQLEASLQSSEFLRSMFSMPVDPRHSLHPLDVSQELLPPLSILSPGSSVGSTSSSPSSPSTGPITPQQVIAQSFAVNASEPKTQAELDLQMEMQHGYTGYAWGSNVLWPVHSELFLQNDFELSAIPPIELGDCKYPALEMELNHPVYSDMMAMSQYPEGGQEGILAFDEMMATQGF